MVLGRKSEAGNSDANPSDMQCLYNMALRLGCAMQPRSGSFDSPQHPKTPECLESVVYHERALSLSKGESNGGDAVAQLEPFQAILEAFRMLSGTLVVR